MELHISPRWISSFSCVAASFLSQKPIPMQCPATTRSFISSCECFLAVCSSEIHQFCVSTASTRSTTSRSQSGAATPVSQGETIVSVEDIQTLVSPRSPSSQASTYKKATKGSVIVTAPEVQRAKKEHREHGRVKPEVYKQYIVAASVWGFALLVIFSVLQQIMGLG
jgi:hypothetical protein